MSIKKIYNKLLAQQIRRSALNNFVSSVSAEDELVTYRDNKSGKMVAGAPFILELDSFGLEQFLPKPEQEEFLEDKRNIEAIQKIFDNCLSGVILTIDEVKSAPYDGIEVRGKINSNTSLAGRSISKKSMKTFNMMWIDHHINMILSDIEEQDEDETLDQIIVRLREVKSLLNEYSQKLFEE